MEFMNYSTSYTNNTFVFFADTKAKAEKTKRAVFCQRSKKINKNKGMLNKIAIINSELYTKASIHIGESASYSNYRWK